MPTVRTGINELEAFFSCDRMRRDRSTFDPVLTVMPSLAPVPAARLESPRPKEKTGARDPRPGV
jgi:hypothetical protein